MSLHFAAELARVNIVHQIAHFGPRIGELPPCMGGWCASRNTCARYWDRMPRPAAERLCPRGRDDQYVPLSNGRFAIQQAQLAGGV